MEIITLIDNVVYGEGLLGEHSSCYLIKSHGKKILFDIGQTNAFLSNAEYLGEDLFDVDCVILSHRIDSHNRGLIAFLELNSTATLYFKPMALRMEHSFIENYNNPVVLVENDIEIVPGITIHAEIQTFTLPSNQTCSFVMEEGSRQLQDPFSDELFLSIHESNHRFLFTGCAHKGIINILKTAYEKNQHKPIQYVFGGMHFSGELLSHIDDYLKQFMCFGIKQLYVSHCTGIDGYMRMKIKYPEKVIYTFTGFHVEI